MPARRRAVSDPRRGLRHRAERRGHRGGGPHVGRRGHQPRHAGRGAAAGARKMMSKKSKHKGPNCCPSSTVKSGGGYPEYKKDVLAYGEGNPITYSQIETFIDAYSKNCIRRLAELMKIQNTVNYVHYNQEVKYLCDTFSDLFDAHQKLLMHSFSFNSNFSIFKISKI